MCQITDSTCTFRTPLNADAHDQCGGDEKAGLQCRKVSQFCDEEHEWHCNRYKRELKCLQYSNNFLGVYIRKLLSSYLMSFSRDCIHVNDLCDGVEQCADGSDEDPTICTSSNELPIRLVDPDAAESGLENIRLGRVEVKYKVKYIFNL